VRLPAPPLLVISDRRQARRPLEQLAAAAFAGGCRWFSLREKDLSQEERHGLLAALVALGRQWGATVTVHDDMDAAMGAAAGGVHLASGGSPKTARARLPDALIGCSAHSAKEASALLDAGADYVTLSPIFLTASKPGYGPVIGLANLAEAAARAPGSIIALGGITAKNAPLCLAAGAGGVAVMGEIMRAADPRAVVEAILAKMSVDHTLPSQ
jgi:thiamine-phosphate pyrophosphorylase